MSEQHFDALVVGAGLGGIYQLYSFLKLGLNCKLIDRAGDVGGTWYYNRYPGAMSDTESHLYRYSWDLEDLKTYPWSNNYIKQEEILKYLNHVVDRHGLRQYMNFNTEMKSAQWSDESQRWKVICGNGEVFVAQYLVTALGILSRVNMPHVPGMETFQGKMMHSARWNPDVQLVGKRVGIIGSGSTGVQLTTALADQVKELHCFIRHPQYIVPSGLRAVTDHERAEINNNYENIWEKAFSSFVAFGYDESSRLTMSVTAEERKKIFEDLWRKGNGFRFMFNGFGDMIIDSEANEEACKFIRSKIAEVVRDPVKAKVLTPTDYYARRPVCASGYYEAFNQDNVFAVDIKQAPISSINEEGIITSDGKNHELDVIIFATGFDAVDGNYNCLDIRGRNNLALKDHWKSGPTSHLGMFVPGFPNMFLIYGPQGPFSNMPPALETFVEHATVTVKDLQKYQAEDKAQGTIETTPELEAEWVEMCEQLCNGNLFMKTSSWILGDNVKGQSASTRFYFGGLKSYRDILEEVRSSGYKGFKIR